MKKIENITFMETRQIIDHCTGEITKEEKTTHVKCSNEPNYVKLYIDCLLTFKDLSKTLNPVLLEFLKYMNYASCENNNGGQTIYVNAQMKKNIAKNINLKIDRINQALTSFVKTNIFRRIGIGTYQVNPNLFGKGEWKDISKIRAKFDFNSGNIETEIEKSTKQKISRKM